jgi:hypothetical protein
MTYEFDKTLNEMTLLELAQEYSAIESQQAEGYEYSNESLEKALEEVTKELNKREGN